ncbi:hypothetical protein, variant [Verruconis gallopava]|uniref:Uncharacterized protein n=1 Tax=Verruconis gallopava TaxID=253628 RepID=A0A0D2AH73_9PEZI|nr:hypothetical protein, variant [Verruconis gallopava]KIW06273.1 hypothetical protein, variant [Verruconis gallopava]
MAWLGLGVFYGGVITGVPVVTGVAEGVHHQKEQNKEAANQTRMIKFFMDCYCDNDDINGYAVVLKHDKVWLAPKHEETGEPLPLKNAPPPHPFTGFFIMYPDDDRNPRERGLLRYGNRTQSIQHIVGPWDWTEDESGIILEGWEGWVAVEEEEREDGLKWALYYDRYDDDLGNGRKVNGRRRLRCSLDRRVLPEEMRKAQELAADEKMQVKSSGDLKTKWG